MWWEPWLYCLCVLFVSIQEVTSNTASGLSCSHQQMCGRQCDCILELGPFCWDLCLNTFLFAILLSSPQAFTLSVIKLRRAIYTITEEISMIWT
jgi:hypothetical protein